MLFLDNLLDFKRVLADAQSPSVVGGDFGFL